MHFNSHVYVFLEFAIGMTVLVYSLVVTPSVFIIQISLQYICKLMGLTGPDFGGTVPRIGLKEGHVLGGRLV